MPCCFLSLTVSSISHGFCSYLRSDALQSHSPFSDLLVPRILSRLTLAIPGDWALFAEAIEPNARIAWLCGVRLCAVGCGPLSAHLKPCSRCRVSFAYASLGHGCPALQTAIRREKGGCREGGGRTCIGLHL